MIALCRKAATFLRLPWRDRWLAVEVAWELARARWEVSFCEFKRYAHGLGEARRAEEAPEPPLRRSFDPLLGRVARFIESLSGLLPWHCTCLVQAMTAQRVLSRRGRETRLYLGVMREGSELKAHAWLYSSGRIVTGGPGRQPFTVVTVFEKTGDSLQNKISQSTL